MEKAKRFEDLWIWQRARELVKEIYNGFRDQIQKAGVSIMNNIAEGFERHTDSETADIRCSRAKQISAGIASLTVHLRKLKK